MQERTITINGKPVAWEGQGSNREQARPQARHVPYHPPPLKRDIQRSIYNTVYHANRAISGRQIAESLGLKKTTWLEAHLQRLVDARYLSRTVKPYRPNMPIYFYEVAR